MKSALVIIGLLAACGCARLHSVTQDDKGVKTEVWVTTFWDGNSALTKFANRGQTTSSNEWAAGTTIGGINQSTTSTNVNALIEGIVAAAVKAAIKP